jgi:uncharacterized protein (TIGR02594 family)
MKKILAILLLCLLPVKANSFEIVIPFSFDGFLTVEKDNIINIALKYDGYNESKNRKELQQLMAIDPVRVPWCAGFLNVVLDRAGYKHTNSLSAASYHQYGYRVTDPKPGDIVLVKRRGGSGRHVAFFYGYYYEDGIQYVQLLGGNQDKAVSIKPVPKNLIVEYRRPIKKVT